VSDADCVRFLQWALPRLHLRWRGYRRVRRQVCKRLGRRLRELGLADLNAYRTRLENDASEWGRLDALCRITISRFYRDRGTWDFLGNCVLPELVRLARERGDREVRCWSAGCASGEEPHTLRIVWSLVAGLREPHTPLRIVATDADEGLLERARQATYSPGSLKDLPAAWRARAFEASGAKLVLRPPFRQGIEFRLADIRLHLPEGAFHLILCRNLAFTYFEEPLQREILLRIAGRLLPGGGLVLGRHEAPPTGTGEVEPWAPELGLYRRAARPAPSRPARR